MSASMRLAREALACACLGFIAFALFHPGTNGSTTLGVGCLAAFIVLVAVMLTRPHVAPDVGAEHPPAS